MFRKRGATDPQVFAGTYRAGSGKKIKTQIEAGDSVDLRIGDERVLVKNVQQISQGRYKGTIYGFEPSFSLEYKGPEDGSGS